MLLQTGQARACRTTLRALVGRQVLLALFARGYEFEVEDVNEPWFQGFKCGPFPPWLFAACGLSAFLM